MIEVSPKNWSPKKANKYRFPYYSDKINDGIFDYNIYGKLLFKPKLYW